MGIEQMIDSIGGNGGFGGGSNVGFSAGVGGFIGAILGRNGLGLNGEATNVVADNCMNSRFTDMMISNTNTNIRQTGEDVVSTIVAGNNNTQAELRGGISSLSAQGANLKDILFAMSSKQDTCCCETQRSIDSVNNNITALAGIITNAIANDGDKTRAQAAQIEKDRLRDELDQTRDELNFTSRGLLTATGPLMSVVAPNPCDSANHAQKIEIINQNVNAIGSTVTQLAGIVQAMATKNA